MRRHRFDPISLVFGLSFTTAAAIVLVGGSLIDDGHFLVPTTLVGLGIALLAQTATRNRPSRGPIAAPTIPLATPTPPPKPYTWSWNREPSGVETPSATATAATSTLVDIPDLPDLPDVPAPAPPADLDDGDGDGDGDDDGDGDGDDIDDASSSRLTDATIEEPPVDEGEPGARQEPIDGLADEPGQVDDALTIEEPVDEPAPAATADDDPTIVEPVPPGTDAWVWKRVEAEDGKPTWVRRPDTDDDDDEGDAKTESPGS